MRVLVLSPHPCHPLRHGGRIRTAHLVGALAQRHQVALVCRADPEAGAGAAGVLARAGVGLHTAPVPADRPGLRRLGRKLAAPLTGRSHLLARFTAPALRELAARQAAQGADVVVVDHVWSAGFLPPELGAPLVLSTHNVESRLLAAKAARESPGLAGVPARMEAGRVRRLERRLLQRAVLTVAVTEEDRRVLSELAPEARIEVVANGVDLQACRPLEPAPGPSRLLFVGSFDYPANREAATTLAQEVLPLLRSREPGARVHLVGRDPEGFLDRLQGVPGLLAEGEVEDLLPAYRAATALAAPLPYGGGSRIKILEAWAFGRPVIATREAVAGLDVRAGCHYLQAASPREMVAAAERLRDEPALAAGLVRAGRTAVETAHDWSTLGRRFADLVGEVAARGPAQP